jgi:MATE family multidrug resistance protein
MASLAVEPLAGIADTAFVERLGAASAAALGAATTLLSSAIWVFNFLGIGAQTEVAQGLGRAERGHAREMATLALLLSVVLGAGFALAVWPATGPAARFMSPDEAVRTATEEYLRIRLLGVPAALVLLTSFGVLRGLQDMRTPLWIAAGVTAANVALDALLIFETALTPGFGIAGAAWATVASQIAGAGFGMAAVIRRIGLAAHPDLAHARTLFRVGRDMVLRTSALLGFLLLATRVALAAGVEAGAAHQALRQIWMLLAFVLDAWAATAQSLIGYFLGAGSWEQARRVARVSCQWALLTGGLLGALLLALEAPVAFALVPPSASAVFASAWPVCALSQPLNALSFVTDGIHWGTRDYAYLRNGMLVSTSLGLVGLASVDPADPDALRRVWLFTTCWVGVRAAFGVLRIWARRAPLGRH